MPEANHTASCKCTAHAATVPAQAQRQSDDCTILVMDAMRERGQASGWRTWGLILLLCIFRGIQNSLYWSACACGAPCWRLGWALSHALRRLLRCTMRGVAIWSA